MYCKASPSTTGRARGWPLRVVKPVSMDHGHYGIGSRRRADPSAPPRASPGPPAISLTAMERPGPRRPCAGRDCRSRDLEEPDRDAVLMSKDDYLARNRVHWTQATQFRSDAYVASVLIAERASPSKVQRTTVPCRPLSTLAIPPSASIRSAMFCSPIPGWAPLTSKPRPWSPISKFSRLSATTRVTQADRAPECFTTFWRASTQQ